MAANTSSYQPSSFDFESFESAKLDVDWPNARRYLTGSLFICHAGADFRRILDDVVNPVVYDRFADGYFLHNRMSGGSENYKDIVAAALYLCDKYLVVVSQHAINHVWVRAETDWLTQHGRAIILCLLDGTHPSALHPELASSSPQRRTCEVDFRGELRQAQSELAGILDDLLVRAPYPRFPRGRPGREV